MVMHYSPIVINVNFKSAHTKDFFLLMEDNEINIFIIIYVIMTYWTYFSIYVHGIYYKLVGILIVLSLTWYKLLVAGSHYFIIHIPSTSYLIS